MKACILIRAQPGKASAVLTAVRKLPGVKKAHLVLGRYDVIALAEVPDYEAAKKLTAKINSIKGLKSSESLIEA
ncbi:Lrp/AsnC ligand binding domain-containing protein [Candidatus Bathyarchaeota archaeon]|nr:Lrp/AsnC ligand binding domain-containing protein [Candidatus Bathyarchaeota archaeon]